MPDNIINPETSLSNPLSSFLERDDYINFVKEIAEDQDSKKIASFTFPITNIDPLACLELLQEHDSYQYFWEKPQDELSIAAGKALISLDASGQSRFKEISTQINAIRQQVFEYSALSHSRSGIHFLGGFSFFDEIHDPAWKSFQPARFTVPEWLIIKDEQLTLLTLTFCFTSADTPHSIRQLVKNRLSEINSKLELPANLLYSPVESLPLKNVPGDKNRSYEKWIDSVTKAKELIRDKRFKKIVLAREFILELSNVAAPTHIINTLRQQYTNCCAFLIRNNASKTFLGCSPERLVSFRKNHLLTEALAGSMQRGATATEDAILEKELLHSAKNADEHNFVIKAIEQRLRSFARNIQRGSKPIIKKLTNVQHLFTPVTAWLKEDVHLLSILEQLHPTPAVGGYPWKKASPYIKELEDFDRGWYAAPVGWLDSHGGGEFTVAIRSGLIERTQARFYAGCGIVADSEADTEWRETNLKLTPMLSALRYD